VLYTQINGVVSKKVISDDGPFDRAPYWIGSSPQPLGVDSLESYLAGYLPQLVLGVAVPAAILLWVVTFDALAAGMLALTIPLLVVFMALVGRDAQARARSRWRVLSLLSGHFLDVVRGLPTLRAFRREGAQAQTLVRVGERYRAETMGTLRLAFLSALVLELCAMVGTALAAVTIGLQLDGGHLQLRAGLTVLLLAPELYGPLRAVGQQFHASADGIAAAERIFAVLDAPAALVSAPLAAPTPRGSSPATRSPMVVSPSAPAPSPAAEPLRFGRRLVRVRRAGCPSLQHNAARERAARAPRGERGGGLAGARHGRYR
jgi:ABC-type transport system involved in cytochrome bd biosynthesis fused ATPase/permease subunit